MQSIAKYFGDNQQRIAPNAGPGHWNDPDMLVIGNFGLTVSQAEAQMALWAILAAPLLMSTDVQRLRPEMANILLNQWVSICGYKKPNTKRIVYFNFRDIIAINQDPLGIQGKRVLSRDQIDVWTRRISCANSNSHRYAVAFISGRVDGQRFVFQLKWSELGLQNAYGYGMVDLYDASNTAEVGVNDNISVIVEPSGKLNTYNQDPHVCIISFDIFSRLPLLLYDRNLNKSTYTICISFI